MWTASYKKSHLECSNAMTQMSTASLGAPRKRVLHGLSSFLLSDWLPWIVAWWFPLTLHLPPHCRSLVTLIVGDLSVSAFSIFLNDSNPHLMTLCHMLICPLHLWDPTQSPMIANPCYHGFCAAPACYDTWSLSLHGVHPQRYVGYLPVASLCYVSYSLSLSTTQLLRRCLEGHVSVHYLTVSNLFTPFFIRLCSVKPKRTSLMWMPRVVLTWGVFKDSSSAIGCD